MTDFKNIFEGMHIFAHKEYSEHKVYDSTFLGNKYSRHPLRKSNEMLKSQRSIKNNTFIPSKNHKESITLKKHRNHSQNLTNQGINTE